MLAVGSVAVGVAALTVAGALGAGARAAMNDRLQRLGTNLVVVRPAQVAPTPVRPAIRGPVTTLTLEDMEAIAREPAIEAVAPGIEKRVRARRGRVATATSVLGTVQAFTRIRNMTIHHGRFFNRWEEEHANRVAVLGARVADALFPDESPVGQSVIIGTVPFDVCGVLDAKGMAADGSDQDGQVLVPVQTALRRISNVTWLNAIFVRVREQDQTPQAVVRLRSVLRTRHRSVADDFEIQNTSRLMAMQAQAVQSLDLLTAAVGIAALAIAGGGIMALMFVSVRERTGEIGLRMAVGAEPLDILIQFLSEAAILMVTGWATGVTAGSAIAAGVTAVTGWPVAPPAAVLTVSLAVAMTMGPLFGAWPARQAASLPPIQALLFR
jgi:putative ABC transport system permease protein